MKMFFITSWPYFENRYIVFHKVADDSIEDK